MTERLQSLYDALDTLPGIRCYDDPQDAIDPQEGYAVIFDIERKPVTWRSFALVTAAIEAVNKRWDSEDILLIPFNPWDPNSIAFQVAGENGSIPDELAHEIVILTDQVFGISKKEPANEPLFDRPDIPATS